MYENNIGLVILAGGGARRMGGANKALLRLGEESFLERLCKCLSFFGEKFLSTNDPATAKGSGLIPIRDVYHDSGPLGGVFSPLRVCRSNSLLVVPCDMPLFDRDAARTLCAAFDGNKEDVLIYNNGHRQPICGIYSKKCLPWMEKILASGDCCIMSVSNHVRMRELPTSRRDIFINVNSVEDLRVLSESKALPAHLPGSDTGLH